MDAKHTYRPLVYFSATFIVTFTLWLTGAYLSFQDEDRGSYMVLMLLGLMTPFIISLLMIFRSSRSDLKREFFNRLINPRLIRVKLLPVFFLVLPCSVLASIGISLLFGGSISQFQLASGFSFSTGFVPVLLLLLLAATFEELGWRGYAFDSLQSRYTNFKASIVFSILWSFWHLPLIAVKNSYQYEIFSQNIWFGVNFFVSIVPMGIIISWICIRNNKSVLAAILFHFIVNLSQEVLAITQVTKCIETGVLTVVAAAIIVGDRKLFFAQTPGRVQDKILGTS